MSDKQISDKAMSDEQMKLHELAYQESLKGNYER